MTTRLSRNIASSCSLLVAYTLTGALTSSYPTTLNSPSSHTFKYLSLPRRRALIGARLTIPNDGILLSCMAVDLSSIITLFPMSVYAWCDRSWFCGAEQDSPSEELWSLVVCTPQIDKASVVRGDVRQTPSSSVCSSESYFVNQFIIPW